jgi:hypothetical protein
MFAVHLFHALPRRNGYVLAAGNWIGLHMQDELPVAKMIATNLTDFPIIPDRCTQVSAHAQLFVHADPYRRIVN